MKTKRAVKVEYTDNQVVIKTAKDAKLDNKGRIVLDIDQVGYLIEDLAKQVGKFPH
jgi:hypothetical protein